MGKDKGDAAKNDEGHELTEEEAKKLADKVIWKPGKGPRDQPPRPKKP